MAHAPSVTYLFSDIEGSTRLWESDPEGASRAIAWHDAVSRQVVGSRHGTVVKMTGDGMHAAFDDPVAATAAAVDLQLALAAPPEEVPALKVRCGLHLGVDQRRDNDFFGPAVNRAARIMSAAHGGQILVSGALAERLAGALPAGARLRELGLVRLKDLTSPERVYQIVHPALRFEFPALRSLASTPNNLPQQLNSFIGRAREMAEVRALLSGNRLVTLLAMGGVGKSRLSIQLGAEVLEDFPDGVWLVELAALTDGADVAAATAAVLGVKEEPGSGLSEALVRFVRERQLLLIVDNCEHVVRAVAELTKRLLQSAPRLKILTSSRDPLNIAGERIYHLPTLPVPAARDVEPEQLARHASVQLFLDRTIAAQPAFRLSEKLAGPVAEICRRLDGIPLALELAAARARSMPVEAIASRLEQRFRLLTTSDLTVLPRQRTLRALIDWSFDLLDERERRLFRRLAVFAGGWTLESAESIAAGDGLGEAEVIEVLASLVEKSLAVMDVEAARYRFLDTVRQYADERLTEAGERDHVRAAHLRFFARLAEEARPHLFGADQATWLARLDAERDNLIAAHETGMALRDDLASLVWLARGTRFYWSTRGQPSKGLQFYLDVLAIGAERLDEADRCRLLFGAGQFCYFLGRHVEAKRHLSECLAIAERTGDEIAVDAVLQPLGLTCLELGELAAAREYLHAGMERARASGVRREILASLTALGMMDMADGSYERAAAEFDEALGIAETVEDVESTTRCLINAAVADVRTGRPQRARERLLQAVAHAAELGSQSLMQYVLDGCVTYAVQAEDWSVAGTCHGLSERLLMEVGRTRERADQAVLQIALDTLKGRVAQERAAGPGQFDLDAAVSAARAALRA